MKLRIKKIITLILCCSIAFSMVACSSSKDKKDKEDVKEKNKIGRYVEKKLKIPDGRFINRMRVLENGNIMVIAQDSEANQYVLLSKGYGKTWTENKIKLPAEGKNKYFMDASIFKNGDGLISYTVTSKENNGGNSEVDKNAEHKYILLDSQGKKKDTNLDFINRYKTKSDKKVPVKNFQDFDNGDLFLAVGNEVVQLDKSTKKEKRKFVNDDLVDNYALVKDSIIIWSSGNVKKYNIKTGKKEDLSKLEDNLKQLKQNSSKLIGNTKSKLYYSNSEGLHCYDMSNNKSDNLIDGDLSRFGSNSKDIVGFSENKDGQFLVAFSGESNGLFNYTYSKNAKAVPDNKIKVYSLNEDRELKKNIEDYNSTNPDVKVEYEIGITGEESGSTEDDIVKKLNTEILAGKGPDIILLDGLPIDSYIKQGVLEDMSDIISKYTSDDIVFKGLKDASTIDGKIYSYPTSIKVPIIFGKKDTINKISDLESFTNTIKDLGSKSDNRIFNKQFGSSDIVPNMYHAYGYNWLNKDKTINKEKLKDFMVKAKEIYKINNKKYKKYITKNNLPDSGSKEEMLKKRGISLSEFLQIKGDLSPIVYTDSVSSKKEPSQLELGAISDNGSYSSVITSKTNDKQLDYKILRRNNKSMIIPTDTVGINSKSGDKELAKDFVKYLLSEEKQKSFRGGLPVNKKSFDYVIKTMIHNPNFKPYLDKANNRTVVGEGTKTDGTKVKNYSPNDDDIKRLKGEIDKAKILPTADIMLLKSVIKEFDSYVKDKIGVDKAVKNVVDNLELYLTE